MKKALIGICAAVVICSAGAVLSLPPTPVVAPSSQETLARPMVDITKPVYLKNESVVCPEITLIFAAAEAYKEGGDAARRRAIANAFVHPIGDCMRMSGPDRIRVIDAAVFDDRLVTIQCLPQRVRL